jgi:hypothetical protein
MKDQNILDALFASDGILKIAVIACLKRLNPKLPAEVMDLVQPGLNKPNFRR